MDYYLDPTELYPLELTKCPGMNPVMRILEEVFNPAQTRITTFRDCILISLDTEYDLDTNRISQIGLASLDTRDIHEADNPDTCKHILTSKLLLLQKQSHRKGAYLFGEPEKCNRNSVQALLNSTFNITDPATNEPRNIILVGHGIRNDILEIKRSSNFDIISLPMIKAIIDTSHLINRVYNTPRHYHSLRDSCALLGMYRRNIHTAGNDAMYTLKALLLLYRHYAMEKLDCMFADEMDDRMVLYRCQLEALGRISRCNNGLGRFAKQRKKRMAKKAGVELDVSQRGAYLDVLSCNGAEMDDVLDDLFTI